MQKHLLNVCVGITLAVVTARAPAAPADRPASADDHPRQGNVFGIDLGWEPGYSTVTTVRMLGEPPAYVKRALRVERAVEALMARAERRYKALLRFVDLRRRELEAAAGHPRKERRLRARLEETVARCNARWTASCPMPLSWSIPTRPRRRSNGRSGLSRPSSGRT